jgi:hypothetical protein
MARYTDADGGVRFDDETASRLTEMVTGMERDDLPLVDISGRKGPASRISPRSAATEDAFEAARGPLQ